MRFRAKVRFVDGSLCVDLPEYQMVPGSFLPLILDVIHPDGVYPNIAPTDPRLNALSCEVEISHRISDTATGRPDISKIKARYRGQAAWDGPDSTIDFERGRNA